MDEQATVEAFMAAWIDGARIAMESEGVDPVTVRRVINRLLYGSPHSPAETEAKANIEAASDGRITMAWDDGEPRLRWNA